MRRRQLRSRRLFYSVAAVVLLTSGLVNAQGTLPGLTDLSSISNTPPTTNNAVSTTENPSTAATTTNNNTPTTTDTNAPTTTQQSITGQSTTGPSSTETSPSNPGPSTTAPTTSNSLSTTPTPSKSSTTPTTAAPNLSSAPTLSSTTSTTGTSVLQILTGSVPVIAGASIPTQVVPDTSAAPFMQKSSLPEGTVFIAVGAILGFLGMSILAWRGLVAWSLHRSVRRAAMAAHNPIRPSFAAGGPSNSTKPGFYASAAAGSSMSLDHLRPMTGRDVHGGSRPNSLFFSPTAGTGIHSSVSNRGSGYLPAGYYASGAAAPAGGNSTTHIGGGLANIPALAGLGPQAAGYKRAMSQGPASPPESPRFAPGYGGRGGGGSTRHSYADERGRAAGPNVGRAGLYPESMSARASTSSVHLMADPEGRGRTPSAYLEDLFEHHGNGMNRI